MIAEPSLESFKSLLGGRGTITLETPTDDGPGEVPLSVDMENGFGADPAA